VTIDVFDALHFSRRLRDMGISEAQAEAGAELARETLMRLSSNLATREDVSSLRSTIELKLEHVEWKFDGKLEYLESQFEAKLEQFAIKFDARLVQLESKLEARFEQLESKFDAKLGQLESKFDAKLGQLGSKFDVKLGQLGSKFDVKLGQLDYNFAHLDTKFDRKLDSLGALLRSEIRVTRVMIGFLGLIVLGTWGVLALPLLTSVRLA
jgi:hypothetical protein